MNRLTIALFALLAAAATAAPVQDATPIPIVQRSDDGPNPDGSYAFSYETGNGIKAQEQGQLQKSQDQQHDAVYVQGSYSYPAEDGNTISLTYVADENGFQPQGAHLPVAPAIPEAIVKALEWIAAHPEEDKQRK
ncbi:endocuticle structural glycoprotein SgAbd-2 [Orussus abietinus]|uniref:endocuticle structural glycoprotein SgAbd-2 n=1 Tax=Orussus abietinus TaxID=222816 RepID=UPI0006256C2B|nr:endocuticle structural glycoprotein SgAbd-2 [Orussus abietinus]